MPSAAQWAEKGHVRRIMSWDESIMHQPTQPVTEFGPALDELAADMFATMAAADGVGLAGPQVGVDLAIFVYCAPDENNRYHSGVMCNPTVELPQDKDRNLDASQEGCLSWPGAYELLARPDKAVCRGVDETGQPVEVRGTGILARCLQHETDHLSGTVFGDRLSNRSRRKLNEERERLRHLYPDDWPITRRGAGEPS
ncbi:MAG: peptide deformylase [Propionibacteriaceae bacterium]|nr:peptide deformylase [Propionibacteriaceae bacterium]